MSLGQPKINLVPYLHTILEQVHPDMNITKSAMSQLNYILNIIADCVCKKAEFLTKNRLQVPGKGKLKTDNKPAKKTLSGREIQSATRLVISGELAKHAVSEGTKAVTIYSTSNAEGSKTKKAKLVLSVPRAEKFIRNHHCEQVSGAAAVYLAAVLQYLSAELLELSGFVSKENKKSTISSRHLQLAIQNDEEFYKMSKTIKFDVLGGGVMPNIHAVLLPKKK